MSNSVPTSAKLRALGEVPNNPKGNLPSWITDAMLLFLREIYGAAPEGGYKWVDDPQKTEILIVDHGLQNWEVPELRPAIVVHRGPIGLANISMDQLRSLNVFTGEREHSDLASGIFTLNCTAASRLESERIAWNTAFAIRAYKRALNTAGLHRIGEEGVQIGSPSSPGQIVPNDVAEEWITTPISVPFYVDLHWKITPPMGELLRAVELKLLSLTRDNGVEEVILKESREGESSYLRGVQVKGE